MDITFKLFASLGDYLPAEVRPGNEMRLTLPEGSCIMDVIVPFNLPAKMVHLVLVNGRDVAPEARASHVLKEGDVLAIWPPIAGG